MYVCPPVSAYLKAVRAVSFEFLMRTVDRQSVGCSDVAATEDVTDGWTDGPSLSRNVCCLQRVSQNDTPSPRLILHFNVHVCRGHDVGRHLHVRSSELPTVRV